MHHYYNYGFYSCCFLQRSCSARSVDFSSAKDVHGQVISQSVQTQVSPVSKVRLSTRSILIESRSGSRIDCYSYSSVTDNALRALQVGDFVKLTLVREPLMFGKVGIKSIAAIESNGNILLDSADYRNEIEAWSWFYDLILPAITVAVLAMCILAFTGIAWRVGAR